VAFDFDFAVSRQLSSISSTFSFPLRSLPTDKGNAAAPFLLQRFYGDRENRLLRRWCDQSFMTEPDSPWPLVLYGPPGTGKSSLAETLACRLQGPCLRIGGDEFRRQFLLAAATRSVTRLRRKLREQPALLLDGLVPDAGQPALIRELVQLIDDFDQSGQSLIVTMQASPSSLTAPLAALRSRLAAGLVLEIKRPGVAARRQIAAELLRRFDLKIMDEDLDWWSTSLPDTAPSIRSCVSRLAVSAEDSLLTRSRLKARPRQGFRTSDLPLLVKLVARELGQPLRDIHGPTRRQEVVRARSLAMYLARELLGVTFRETGRMIGGRDASTARHAHARIRKVLSDDPALAQSVTRITARWRSSQKGAGENLSTR
jgi:chromosomal replication initiator protein